VEKKLVPSLRKGQGSGGPQMGGAGNVYYNNIEEKKKGVDGGTSGGVDSTSPKGPVLEEKKEASFVGLDKRDEKTL